ncbi:MAG: diacylglycerol kinase family lipid kinase [Myxococcales bacterium]|nr:diacylglycerol kinase family lipid kinase [Myxococcales bacterium]MCB9520264.1 diacylglycerol kinase family lipid kinase [Myxococcales bacterium]MCB9531368.1 diacylglycerol kinase family lipid kinase [Myxococcales bacterium]MCB9533559.1 diacylglycerol kinase family lipid kinase [Myxococcales bacterium]
MTGALAIVNPAAGGGRCGRAARGALEPLLGAGVVDSVLETSAPGDATRIAANAWRDGRRRFVSVGGDGTTYEIVNGLFPAALGGDERPELGYLPLGTGNSFLRDFGDDGPARALGALRTGRSKPCDVIRATHADGAIFYTNLLSVGFTADVGATVNAKLKPLGELGYGVGVVWEVARLAPRPIPFALDDGALDSRPVVFLSFNNSRFTGGKMMMAPRAAHDDGLVDVIVAGDLGRLELLATFPKIFAGTHTEHAKVSARTARRVRFELAGAIDVMVDGEVVSLWLRELEVLPGALRVMA